MSGLSCFASVCTWAGGRSSLPVLSGLSGRPRPLILRDLHSGPISIGRLVWDPASGFLDALLRELEARRLVRVRGTC